MTRIPSKEREKELETIIRDIYWMARRYADGRHTYAPSMYNEAIYKAQELGLDLKPDSITGTLWATDGDYGLEEKYK